MPKVGPKVALRSFVRRAAGGLSVALLALSFGVSTAHAQSYGGALRDGVAARDRALETHDVRDWRQALEHFERAVGGEDTMAARFELAEAAARLELIDVAYESYELALAKGLSGKAEWRARAFVEANAGKIARLELVAPAGTLVYVNGRQRGALPFDRPLAVSAGLAELRLLRASAEPWEKSVMLEARVVMRLAPQLEDKNLPGSDRGVPLTERPSWLAKSPMAVALLTVAGVSLVTGGALAYYWSNRENSANDARAQITSAYVDNRNNGIVDLNALPCGENSISRGMGIDSGIPSDTADGLASDYASACNKLEARAASADRFRTASFVSLGVGAAASVTVLLWYLFDGKEQPPGGARPLEARPGPRVVPVASAEAQGVWLSFEF